MPILLMENKLLTQLLLALARAEQAAEQAHAVSWAAVFGAPKWELGREGHRGSG